MIDWRQATQQIGRALMLPIAVLPVAGLLLRFGQPDLLDLPFVSAAGNAIFAHLGLLFAIGVAVGLAKENHGAAGLAGVVGFLIASEGIAAILGTDGLEVSKLGVPIGILSGIIAGVLYNRYSDIQLPAYLAFFGGRRFVPIASGCAALVVAAVFGFSWPYLNSGMDALSHAVIESGGMGLFVFGVLNRILIVTGLHHILNNVAWFIVGDFQGVSGDLKRFFAGDPNAGAFMTGFFPVMMFGLPAACFAMYRQARPERRKAVGGMLLSMGLTSFLTGVTEPIEFSFMFLAPVLYALHALLTGVSMALMDALNVHLGFSFSAGALDFVLNLDKAQKPWLLLPVGAAYALVYYFAFTVAIRRFNLATPGREAEGTASLPAASSDGTPSRAAQAWIDGLGGASNILDISACTTRLRLDLKDRQSIQRDALKQLGARGTIEVGKQGLQVVVGPEADRIASQIRTHWQSSRLTDAGSAPQPLSRQTRASAQSTRPALDPDVLRTLVTAMGGQHNIKTVVARSGRALVSVHHAAMVERDAIAALFPRGVYESADGTWHLLHADAVAMLDLLPTMPA
ncbi:PTS N-acetyl-D-glucosamine transporter [Ahniella affigens]|uniref:PTS N-acetyl-D-glucosamine transporter n=1 Tax=Ahniella affigens TaxID=2021234 RepID=A0A2P1PUX9_9GAMM|nr:N-acetylglucosamine-specific PTS transporter subunit IIBC [Ahniella affigens]AVP98655.1 PTS N-acetyl-D-glucosamine transporter [Ahniella affigens]